MRLYSSIAEVWLFVQSIHEALEKRVNAKAQIKADLEYYQNYDNVSHSWTYRMPSYGSCALPLSCLDLTRS